MAADLPAGFVPADAPSPEEAKAFITAEATRQGVDPETALRIAGTESSFNHSQVSPKGAIGLMQLLKGTADDMGVDPLNWQDNVRGGVKYYKTMLQKFGDPKLAAAAYNAGPGAVAKAGGIPNNPETQAYVQKVAGAPAAAPAAKVASADIPDGFEAIDDAGHTDVNLEGSLKAAASGGATGLIGGSVGMPGEYGNYVRSQRDPKYPYLATSANHSPADSIAMLAPDTSKITHFLGLDYKPENNTERYIKAGATGGASMPGGMLSRAVMAAAGIGGEAATQIQGQDGTPDESFRPQGLALGSTLGGVKAGTYKAASLAKDIGSVILNQFRKASGEAPAAIGTLNKPDQVQQIANILRSYTVQNQNPPNKDGGRGPDAGDMLSQAVAYLKRNNRGSLLGKMLQ